MPNNIKLVSNFTDLLDESYQSASVTADLVSDSALVKAGANANEICYPQISVTGLGDYDRNSGYTDGSVTLEWKTTKFNYDRGSKISVDVMDDEETYNLAFAKAGSVLMKSKVAPEADAFTFATILSEVLTFIAFFAYADIKSVHIEWYLVVATIFVGLGVAYAAMFGYDKLKQALLQIKNIKE